MSKKKLAPEKELENIYFELKEVSSDLRKKLDELLKDTGSKDFRRMVNEKELTQFLSGYTQIKKLQLDILKEKRKEEEVEATSDLSTLLGALGSIEELGNLEQVDDVTVLKEEVKDKGEK